MKLFFRLLSFFFIHVYSKEIHIPGYNYCGPGTKFTNRTKNGDKPINSLDICCYKHDETYIKNNYTFSKESDIQFIKCSNNVYKTTSDKEEKLWAYLAVQSFKLKLFYLLKIKRLENKMYKN
jgi:hypothetical protein